MKPIKSILAAACLLCAANAGAIGWPANFEGVMLQGFWWDSYQTETTWPKLEARVDELSPYFKLIWVPNSAKSSGGLGYIPIYWFTNHNSDMGTEAQLRSMIATYKAAGVGILADLVINHRAGVSNWTNFPTETWNGQTWSIGPEGICCDDEVKDQSGQATPTGNYDTGEGYGAARDLDHTNANVQNNCKNFCKCLLEDFGYVGYRVDMCKGYGGQYLKIYNQYAQPTYSVGEYWDGSYDAVAAWIESTGGESAAFDFPFKYAVNDAFSSGDMTKLVWYENGVTPKPAGMIHHWYQQLAVTFIDNHDTYRDSNAFSGNWAAANAFMICSPGTPCVFLPHWNACGDQIAKMIEARNAVGVTNTSDVTVLRTNSSCYMAEVTGTRGKLVVKVGPEMVSPDGYTDSQIYCYGEDYCIWTTTGGGGGGDTYPSNMYILGNLSVGSWTTNAGIAMTKDGSKYTADNVEIADAGAGYGYFTFVTKLSSSASDWNTVNGGDRYGAATKDEAITSGGNATVVKYTANGTAGSAYSWKVAAGTYDMTLDLSSMTLSITGAGQEIIYGPDQLYILGNLSVGSWTTNAGVTMTKTGSVFNAKNVEIIDADSGYGYFTFVTKLASSSSDWNTVNGSDRYGAASKDLLITKDVAATITKFAAGTNASSAYSWKVTAGKYDVNADFSTNKVTLTDVQSGIETVVDMTDEAVSYYDLMGRPVAQPQPGTLYLERRGANFRKILYK